MALSLSDKFEILSNQALQNRIRMALYEIAADALAAGKKADRKLNDAWCNRVLSDSWEIPMRLLVARLVSHQSIVEQTDLEDDAKILSALTEILPSLIGE